MSDEDSNSKEKYKGTDVVEKALERHAKFCPYTREKDNWFNSQMLKVIGVTCAVLSPWFIWATVSIFSLSSETALIKQKQDVVEIMQRDIKEIKESLIELKIKVAKIEQKVGLN